MKNFTRNALSSLIALSAFAGNHAAAADVSYNIGFASEYYFRGILQKESSASAGVDIESNGFYAGAWTADVGDGLEVDLYGGYGFETESGLTGSIGFTGYYYTGDFDDTYEEINLGLGYGMFSLGYSSGEWDGFNIGMNYGSAAGQTVEWPHVHLIPRHVGDVKDPTGGVRNTIPGKGNYHK